MDDLMKAVLKRIKRQRYYANEDLLRAFITQVDKGITPPDYLLEFMAEGAREFLKGGKAWQKKGGRPLKPNGPNELTAYLLSHYGGLSAERVATVLGSTDIDGGDREQTMRRTINRGLYSFVGAKVNSPDLIKTAFDDALKLEFTDLTNGQRRKCIEGLRAGLADLLRDDAEPICT